MTRDFQREKVYSAEYQLRDILDFANKMESRTVDFFGSKLELPLEYHFGTVENVQTYVNQVYRGWLKGRIPPRVRARQGQTKAHYSWGEIAVPVERIWALREIVVLHEIAHDLTRSCPVAHGPEFAGAFLWLLSEVVGPEVGLLLTQAFDENGVKIAPFQGLTSQAS